MNKEYGEKAKSLITLKERGLFKKNLIVLEKLIEKQNFIELLKNAGFKENSDIAVRFSSPTKNINLPRSIVIDSFNKAYEFIERNIKEGIFPIIHEFIFPEYGGTLIKKQNKIYASIINGAWEQESAHNCDNILIENNKATIWFSLKEKECLFVEGDKLIKRKVKNEEEDIRSLVLIIFDKIKEFDFEDDVLYEFALTPQKDFVIMEYKKINNFDGFFQDIKSLPLEIKRLNDLDNWNKKDDLLISVPISRENDIELLKIIEYIKPYKNKVFISYGLCSHPSIILREQGINTILYTKDKIKIEINF